MSRKLQVVHHRAQAQFLANTWNAEERTIDVCWTTGASGLQWDYRRGELFEEELQVDETACDMTRLNLGAPVLDSHQRWSVKDQFGRVIRAWIKDGQGFATLKFSKRADVAGIVEDIADDITKNISVGYRVLLYRDITPEGATRRKMRAEKWQPFEISFTPVGLDAGAQSRSAGGERGEPAGQRFEVEFIENARAASMTHKERAPMDEEQKRQLEEAQARAAAAEAKAKEEAEQAKKRAEEAAAQARAAERQRQADIMEAAETLGLRSLGAEHCKKDTTVDEFRAIALRAKAKADEADHTSGQGAQVAITRDEKKTRAEAMSEVLLHRHNPTAYKLTEKGQRFHGMSLLRMAEEVLGGHGGRSRSEIAQRALSTSDFALLCESTVRRTLRDSYTLQPRTFQPFVRFGRLPDYRETKRVAFGDAPSLERVVEGAEYTQGAVGEAGEAISLLKYGKIVAVTEEVIVNDDLDAMTRLPGMMGAAAARLESKLVYDMLLANPDMADSVALFHADHGNLGTTGVPSETTLNEMREDMRLQTTVDGSDYLEVMPEFLIVGPTLETTAQKLLSSVLAASTSNVNVFANWLKLIVEPRVTGSKWFAAANPNQIDTIEVAYLDGMNGPEVSRKDGFEVDGVAFKVKHVVGVKAIDHRGLYYNQGA